jgi:hypothetical protein
MFTAEGLINSLMFYLPNIGGNMVRHSLTSIFCLILSFNSVSLCQTEQSLIKEGAPKIYIDCGMCDLNYIKEQISIVNYVNDRRDADVHVLFVSQRTGASGNEYTLFFIGQNQFNGINDTLKFATDQTDTRDKEREKTVSALKLGLVRYIAKSKVADQLSITFIKQNQQTEKPKDEWDFWFFQASINGFTNGQERNSFLNINGSFSASRVTEDSKINLRASNSYNEREYKYEVNKELITYNSISRSQSFNGSVYFSIDDHWSWGFGASLWNSTYSNITLGTILSAAIEYNIFPYSQSNQRQLRINYRIAPTYHKYTSETIYFKTKERLLSQELSSTLSIIEPWGNTSITVSGANYFHDMNKYELEISGNVSWKIVKGLSINLYGGYSKIRNQISLPRGGATLEEVLLQRRQLETGYSYWAGFGISYSFGSIYNNIVNPRFGSVGGGGQTIIISN